MTSRDFMNAVANGKTDVVQALLDVLEDLGVEYCVIGGLAVNTYVEPVVSLDLDVVVAATHVDKVCAAMGKHFGVRRGAHSVDLTSSASDLRIQLQTDPRYQGFLGKATAREVLGYELRVAAVEDVLQGKVWAYSDTQRRRSKRQKDLADILRFTEAYPALETALPASVRDKLT